VGWLGAQTMVGTVLRGRTTYAGRLSAIIRIGHIIGPPMVGAAWDLWGAWAAFGLISFCGIGGVISALMLPRQPLRPTEEHTEATPPARLTLRDLMPSVSDYLGAFRML